MRTSQRLEHLSYSTYELVYKVAHLF